MAYTVPTPADLKTAYPAFAGVADGAVQAALDRHGEMIDDGWPTQAQFTTGVMLYACHVLYLSGLGRSGASAERGGDDVKRMKAGDREAEFFSLKDMGATGASTLPGSPYGREFKALLRRLFGGPRVY